MTCVSVLCCVGGFASTSTVFGFLQRLLTIYRIFIGPTGDRAEVDYTNEL